VKSKSLYTCLGHTKPWRQRWKTSSCCLGKYRFLVNVYRARCVLGLQNVGKVVLFLWGGIPIFIKAIRTVVITERKLKNISNFCQSTISLQFIQLWHTESSWSHFWCKIVCNVLTKSRKALCIMHNESQIKLHMYCCLQLRFTWKVLRINCRV